METICGFSECVTPPCTTLCTACDQESTTSRLLTELMDVYERERRANELINSLHLRLCYIEHENKQMKQTLSYAAIRMKRPHDTAS